MGIAPENLMPDLSDLSVFPILLILFSLHCLIGIVAAGVAQQKGFNFKNWLILGLIGGTLALAIALFSKPKG